MRYPQVKVYEVGQRVRSVYGTAMTSRATPGLAAGDWLSRYGAVFGADPLELEEVQEIPLRRGGRWAYLYSQTMDGLPVVGSSLRVLVREGISSHVIYAAGRIGARPEGGLPRPTVTPAEAVRAAQAHPTGQGLAGWSEPELVAMYDDAPRGNGEAYPAWRCIGGDPATIESYSFYVHGLTGEVRRVHSNILHGFDITGNVKAKATPAITTYPEILGPDTWDGTKTDCPNDPAEVNLSEVLILAYDPQTHALVASAYTDSNGGYTLAVDDFTVVDLEAHLIGPGSEVYADTYVAPPYPPGTIWGKPLDPLTKTGVTAPASGKDFYFNQIPNEDDTGYVNAHKHLTTTWNYLGLDSDQLPLIPLIVNSDFFHFHNLEPNAAYFEAGFCLTYGTPCAMEEVPWPGRLMFGYSNGGIDPNTAYSTWVSHEFGHYALDVAFGIGTGSGRGFHEGFADTLAHLVHDTRVWGQDFFGCGGNAREPWVDNYTYPTCETVQHKRGELLSKVWLNILFEMRTLYGQVGGLDATRDLHREWMPIAQAPGGDPDYCPEFDQSASVDTLIEVLVADSPDSNPANAPHLTQICDAFSLQDISYPPLCGGDSSGRVCYADFDASTGPGVLDIFDFLAFQESFVERDPSACDCDTSTGPGVCDVFDFICFKVAFAAGCEQE